VKKLIKPYITENFGKFITCDFLKKLKEWGKFYWGETEKY
jgi:hypothetical protein